MGNRIVEGMGGEWGMEGRGRSLEEFGGEWGGGWRRRVGWGWGVVCCWLSIELE